MIDHVVLDVEIQKCVGDGGLTWEDTDQLGVSVACVWEWQGERMRIYGPDDLLALRERLLKADRISGFNITRFDLPVIWGLPGRERVAALRDKTDDILRRIWQALGLDPDEFTDAHKGWGLNAVCQGTLGAGKIGFGGDAPKWFQAGRWARVASYCADDVALERDLGRFIDRHGFVVQGSSLRTTPARVLRVPPWSPGAGFKEEV